MGCSCQLIQDTPPLLGFPCLKHIHLFVLLVCLFQMSSGIVGLVSKAVKEKVSMSCDYNFCPEELPVLRIYWQKHDKMVLAVIAGETKVWPEYKNRTFHDNAKNYSLSILGLVLSDRGKYTCVVQKNERGEYERKHLNTVELAVRADFPTPNITESGNPSAYTKRITCFTSGGFPEPHLSWLDNGRELNGINTTISQDPESELYTISSQLDFNITFNHTIKCLIEYGDAHVSRNFTWEKPPEGPPDKRNKISSQESAGLGVGIPVFLIMLYFIYKCRSCSRRRTETSGEANNHLYIGPTEVSAEETV